MSKTYLFVLDAVMFINFAEDAEDVVVDEVVTSMGKTDKQARNEKRKKAQDRLERRTAKRNKHLNEDDDNANMSGGFSVVAKSSHPEEDENGNEKALTHEELQHRNRILAGMGKLAPSTNAASNDGEDARFDVVKHSGHFNAIDNVRDESCWRTYSDYLLVL
jgi:hypothetical protein